MKTTTKLFATPLFLGVSLLSLSDQALAQETASNGSIAEAIGADGDIVITARRRNETVQETPIAVTAITTSALEAKATMNLGDLQGAAPNVLIQQASAGANTASISIRGLAFNEVSKAFDPTVAVVQDGIVVGNTTGQFLDFFDVESIEVLRGPQGTLFGRNTIGGVINVRRTRPTGEWGGKFEVSYGSYSTLAARAVLNAPIVEGVLAAKAFYFHNETSGYYRHYYTGRRAGGSNGENFGLSLLFTPSDNFDALLTIDKQVKYFDPTKSSVANSSEVFCSLVPAIECNRDTESDLYTVFTDYPDTVGYYSTPSATLEMNLDLGSVKLTSLTGYRDSRENVVQDFDALSGDLFVLGRAQTYNQISQELRAAGKFGSVIDYVVGAYYFRSHWELEQLNRVFGAVLDPQFARQTSKSLAFFGDFDINITEQVRASLGGRWTRDQKSLYNFATFLLGDLDVSYSKFTPKVGVDFRPNENHMFYGSWSRGYRSGGLNDRAQTVFATNRPYGPETVDAFEVGVKNTLFDRRLHFNIAAFYSRYKDLQVSTTVLGGPLGLQSILDNAGRATIKGLEFDMTARASDRLKFHGSLGLLKAKFNSFTVQSPDPLDSSILAYFDYSRNRLLFAPKATASIDAEYTAPLSFGDAIMTLGYRYISPYDQHISTGPLTPDGMLNDANKYIVNGNDPRVRSDKQNFVDASLTVRFDLGKSKARATLYGRNLLDDRGPTQVYTVAGLWTFGSAREPRTYGIQLGYEF